MARRTGLLMSVFLAVLGYVGAAIFYSGLIGYFPGNQWICPVCIHITSSGDPLRKFLHGSIAFGTMNALLFVCAWWLLVALYRAVRRLASKSATAHVRLLEISNEWGREQI
jgi:hypothetical protein